MPSTFKSFARFFLRCPEVVIGGAPADLLGLRASLLSGVPAVIACAQCICAHLHYRRFFSRGSLIFCMTAAAVGAIKKAIPCEAVSNQSSKQLRKLAVGARIQSPPTW